jgi:transaldolase
MNTTTQTLASNPSIFELAMGHGDATDAAIQALVAKNMTCEDVLIALALQDLTQAADRVRPTFDETNGADGWVSLDVSPLLANDTRGIVQAAAQWHAHGARPNVFINVPGTPEGLAAVEALIFHGVPVNVTWLFSPLHCALAAQAYLRGLEQRFTAGLDPKVASVASLFVMDSDAAMSGGTAMAMAMQACQAHGDYFASQRWQLLADGGARPQRLLWESSAGIHAAEAVRAYALTALRAFNAKALTRPQRLGEA